MNVISKDVPPHIMAKAELFFTEVGLPSGHVLCEGPVGEPVSFSIALSAVKQGARISRTGWNGKNMYVELQRPDAHSTMTLPYLYMRTAQGDLVPWLISQTDALAADWLIAMPVSI